MEGINRTGAWPDLGKDWEDCSGQKKMEIPCHWTTCMPWQGLKDLSQVKYRYMYMHMYKIVLKFSASKERERERDRDRERETDRQRDRKRERWSYLWQKSRSPRSLAHRCSNRAGSICCRSKTTNPKTDQSKLRLQVKVREQSKIT